MANKPKSSGISKARAKQRVSDFRKGVETAKVTVLPLLMRRYFIRGMAAGVVVTAILIGVALYLTYNAGILIVDL